MNQLQVWRGIETNPSASQKKSDRKEIRTSHLGVARLGKKGICLPHLHPPTNDREERRIFAPPFFRSSARFGNARFSLPHFSEKHVPI
jgi:hypothetical protein